MIVLCRESAPPNREVAATWKQQCRRVYVVQGALMPRILAPLKAPPASFGWFASIKPFGPAARLRFGFASTVAIKVGAFSTIKRSSWQPGFFASLFFGLKTPPLLSLSMEHALLSTTTLALLSPRLCAFPFRPNGVNEEDLCHEEKKIREIIRVRCPPRTSSPLSRQLFGTCNA